MLALRSQCHRWPKQCGQWRKQWEAMGAPRNMTWVKRCKDSSARDSNMTNGITCHIWTKISPPVIHPIRPRLKSRRFQPRFNHNFKWDSYDQNYAWLSYSEPRAIYEHQRSFIQTVFNLGYSSFWPCSSISLIPTPRSQMWSGAVPSWGVSTWPDAHAVQRRNTRIGNARPLLNTGNGELIYVAQIWHIFLYKNINSCIIFR